MKDLDIMKITSEKDKREEFEKITTTQIRELVDIGINQSNTIALLMDGHARMLEHTKELYKRNKYLSLGLIATNVALILLVAWVAQ